MNKEQATQNIINYIYEIENKHFKEEYSDENNNWLDTDEDVSNFIKDNKKEIEHIFVSLFYLAGFNEDNDLSVALDIMLDEQVEEFCRRIGG